MRNVHKGKPVAPLELERTWSCCVDAISFLTSLNCSSLLFLLFMLFLLKPLSTDAFCGAGPPFSACPFRHDMMSSGMQPRAVPCISVVSSLVSSRPLSCSGSHCRRALRRRGELGPLLPRTTRNRPKLLRALACYCRCLNSTGLGFGCDQDRPDCFTPGVRG